jgi:hypothetical protein
VGSSLEELLAERSVACRLTPDRALETFEDAVAFLSDRGVLTRTPDCSLPSLFEACHEEPYLPGGHGFAAWPKTKYAWAGELEQHRDCLALKIHRGKNILLHGDAIEAAAPICLAELDRMENEDPDWRRLLRHLAGAGPSTLEDLLAELGLKPKQLRAIRSPLERCGAVVARQRVLSSATAEGGHMHTSELARFDQVYEGPPRSGADEALYELHVLALRAAVVAPESEIPKWFSWRWRIGSGVVERLIVSGRVVRLAGGYITPAEGTDL